jgi:segregation and condensation protein B
MLSWDTSDPCISLYARDDDEEGGYDDFEEDEELDEELDEDEDEDEDEDVDDDYDDYEDEFEEFDEPRHGRKRGDDWD